MNKELARAESQIELARLESVLHQKTTQLKDAEIKGDKTLAKQLNEECGDIIVQIQFLNPDLDPSVIDYEMQDEANRLAKKHYTKPN